MYPDESDIIYMKESIIFFKKVMWLYSKPITKILLQGSLELIPNAWLDDLLKLNNDELNTLVANGEVNVCISLVY